jgi:hypothetical protein
MFFSPSGFLPECECSSRQLVQQCFCHPLDHTSCEPRVNRSKQFVSKAHVAMVSWQQRQAWAPDDPDDDNLA